MKISRQRPLTILMLTPFFRPNVGGVEVHLNDLCTYLRRRGHRIDVLTYQPLTEKTRAPTLEKNDGIRIYRISWFGYRLFYRLEPYPVLQTIYALPGLMVFSLLYLLMRVQTIDVVHAHGFIAALAGRLLMSVLPKRARWVVSIHTTYSLPLRSSPWLGRVFAWILNGYHRILCVSPSVVGELARYGLDENKVSVFTYWADRERFKPIDKEKSKELVGWGRRFVVLFVGRLIKIKGIHILAKAAKLVDNNINFAFITTGTYADFLRATEQKELSNNIIYVGTVAHSKLHLYYNAADMLVVPSQQAEGFARVAIEAMLCGTPVLASNVGYLSQVVNPDVGELIDPPTPENFAKRIMYYYSNKTKLKELQERCEKYASDRFTEKNALTIERAYYGSIA